jgi:hypothetical protein
MSLLSELDASMKQFKSILSIFVYLLCYYYYYYIIFNFLFRLFRMIDT